ncbi:MAG TPA: cytochrome c3 family protein [Holophagaceae bacterium]|nr:cytochrome c3 family protein [Holophagaceae bacterium]
MAGHPLFRNFVLGLALAISGWYLSAGDPPHNASKNIQCTSCHKLHNAPGGNLTTVSGNTNLCLSCHVSGGLGAGTGNVYAFTSTEQALPGGGLPSGVAATGTSHRWDAGISGRISLPSGQVNTSTGSLSPTGAYTGAYARTYLIKVTTSGSATTAVFQYQATNPVGVLGTAVTGKVASITGTLLDMGVSLKFADGTSGTSFALNDQWYLHVRPDLALPANAALRLEGGKLMCSSCHDQHLQAKAPFDPAAPATYTAGTTTGRHFQRIDNDQSQMCVDCHSPRNVTAKGGTSHPVAVALPGTTDFKTPGTAVLDRTANRVQCQSCHDIHKTPTANGLLLRAETTSGTAGSSPLCNDCHTYATAATNKGIHFDTTLGVLWPGGKFGSPITTYPAFNFGTDAAKRATCANCHQAHGWADSRDTTKHYGRLLVDEPSNLCLTCHSSNATAPYQLNTTGTAQTGIPDINTELGKTVRHPMGRVGARTVACGDCHNPHKAMKGSHAYATTATSTRNLILNGATVQSGPLMGADGVAPTWGAKWVTASGYTVKATATYEYEVCLKCHSSYDSYGTTRPGGITAFYATGTAKFTNGSTAVTGTGTTWTSAMVGMYIQKGTSSPAYRISAFVSATSLTLGTAYGEATDAAAAAYTITREQTDLALEFNTKNASFHPVAGGLASTGTGSTALASGRTVAPWTTLGTQTMMCSDCHNTDGTAAQGPHGSASQFMLKNFGAGKPTPDKWPAVTLTNARSATVANQSWCNNCHPMQTSTNNVHTTGNHSSAQCYNCHVVVPHGGKIGRLIATNTAGMPSRYSYQNVKTNSWLRAFVKSTGSYSESNCGSAQSGCTNHSLASSASNSW